MKNVHVGNFSVGNDETLTLIAGPCQLESSDHAQMIAGQLQEICSQVGANLIFKASFDKANRTSISGTRGLGIDRGLEILAAIRNEFSVPVLTDVHMPEQCAIAAQSVDVIQIPAFLCRQTDLLIAAGNSGATVNIKKGQFMAPWDMSNAIGKIESTGNHNILLTERGVSFGYNTLVTDMRSLPEMMKTGHPVVMDATHSVSQPGGLGGSSGGQREFAPTRLDA